MRDWFWLFWIIVWFLSTVDFSVIIGDKNEVVIEKKETKQEEKSDFPKGGW